MNSNLERFDFTFNEYAGQFKARQIASAIELAIYKGVKQFSAARKTVVKAYHHLIEKGVVESQSRQGYFVLHNKSKAMTISVPITLTLLRTFIRVLSLPYSQPIIF